MGVPPGTVDPGPLASQTEVDLIAFSPQHFQEQRLTHLEALKDPHPAGVTWVNVDGLANGSLISQLGELYHLHRLALEDVVNTHQRPKVEIYDGTIFIVLRMIYVNPERTLDTEQLSLFLGKDFVLTFQEGVPGDCLEPVRDRLRKDQTRLRNNGADFLAYNLIDTVIDSYFPLLESMGERLEDLENMVLLNPSPGLVRQIHDIKRDLLQLRRAIWPLREALGPLFRDDLPQITPETRIFLRDCYDHCIQIIDLIETYRELGSSLMDVYLSSVSNRMNEVMKVLTIITTIFVPLTFIAGIYGMNFNPEKSPWNMPELNARYGYPLTILACLLIATAELYYFWRQGWIFARELLPPRNSPEVMADKGPKAG